MLVNGIYLAENEIAINGLGGLHRGFKINAALDHIAEDERGIRFVLQEFRAYAFRGHWFHIVDLSQRFPGVFRPTQTQKDQPFIEEEHRMIALRIGGTGIIFRSIWEERKRQLQEVNRLLFSTH